MERIERSALVPCSREAAFDVVAEVASYPDFVPLCRSAVVRPAGPDLVEASLHMGRGPIRFAFTTRNRLVAPNRIELRLVSGPFRRLYGEWSFAEEEEGRTRVTFWMEFEISSRLVRRMLGPFLEEVASSMVSAFSRRAVHLERSA